MKLALAILTLLAMFSFLYFCVVSAVAIVGARLERQPFPPSKTSFGSTLWDGGPYTERGKELMARYYRNFFFAFASGMVMVVSGAGYVHLRDGAVGPSPFKSPVFIAAPAIVFGNALMAFLGCALWLLVCLAGAALRKLRGESTSDAQRRQIFKSLQWTAGCFVVAALSLVIMRHQ
ncbi:MAG: hypothetical protein FD144_1263 [Rhodospirillaceae bacterium]|nr:MAG: hypothetical protein FD144_1263 [Rhodospirillaceae bacterium]